ncbi:MAG: hypothetical protein K6A72_07305 [Lachnospiraceae bacterium]|nr:hypothetical protein [Lachnospiraceae bacterium]
MNNKDSGKKEERFELGAFSYADKVMADDAERELKRIQKLEQQIDYSKPKVVHLLYDKMINASSLRTPEGLIYMSEMYGFLREHSTELDHELRGIPVEMFSGITRTREAEGGDDLKLTEENFNKLKRRLKREKQESKSKILSHRIVIAFLAAAIVVMFIIAFKSDTPNILNYETALQNKYAAWDAELTQREAELRARTVEMQDEE